MAPENKLGLTSSADLAREEERLSKKKAVELFENGVLDTLPAGKFSTLQAIHKYLFEDIYDFAGKLRTVNLAKGNFRFAPLIYLEAALANIDKMPQSTFDEIIEKYVEMNIAHPFREGNGRSTRIWLDHILKTEIGKVMDWSKVDKEDAVQRDVHKQCGVPRCRQLSEFAEHHEFVIKKGRDTQARVCPCFQFSSNCHFNLFTAEGHAVFINRPDPGGRQLGFVFLIVDLLQGRLGQLFQLFVAAIFLRFQLNQDTRKALLRGLQLNVIAPVARFPVGGHESAAQQGAQAQHKAVVEVLPGGIEGADRLGQQRLNLRFQPCVIAGEDGLLNGDRRGRRDQIL